MSITTYAKVSFPDTDPIPPAGGGMLAVNFASDNSANMTLTSMAAGEQFLGGSARYSTIIDLADFTEARIAVRRLATAGAAGATVSLQYSTINPGTAWVAGDWTPIASVNIALQNSILDSGWTAIPAPAIADSIYIAMAMEGGDGVASPVIGSLIVYFR